VIAPHIGFGKGYRGQDDKLFCHWFSVQNDFLNQADYGGQNAAGEHFSRADPDGVVLSAHWVAVYQATEGGPASLHLATSPVGVIEHSMNTGKDRPFAVEHLPMQLLLALKAGRTFNNFDIRHGNWRNYLVGVIGEVAVDEIETLWPNQVFHGKRTQHNLRSILDLAYFLSDATQEDIDLHRANLELIAAERRYDWKWCWELLQARWGSEVLWQHGITPTSGFLEPRTSADGFDNCAN